jgi:uncharacterized repeat protein (TIGR04138 family)
MQALNFDEVLSRITTQDARYHREAYLFLREALEQTQKSCLRTRKTESQQAAGKDVTGKELLEGIREYALTQFGPMAKTVLNEWGITRCEDFGELVFNMVEQGLLSKTENDSRDDFKGGYDFDQAFCQPFRPRPVEVALPSPEPNVDPDVSR